MFQTLTRSKITIDDWRLNIYGFLPVTLMWLIRVSVGVFAYMYNSYIGFFHLIWVIISFLIPTPYFYLFSCYLMLPLVISEFSLLYVANIKSYDNARLYSHPVVEEFLFHPKKPFLELSLIYSIVIFVGMMFPARLRLQHFLKTHSNRTKSMIADLMVERINNKSSSVLWKILFIVLVNIRTPVLFLMLFIGNQNFNLFQLGFMLFFVAFGASELLYNKFSILLPVFISYFILTQYCWSLV